MPKSADFLQGTLDMLILKAVSLGPLHGYGCCCASSRSPENGCPIGRARSSPRCTDWSIRASSAANGASRTTNARPSTIHSPLPAAAVSQEETRNWARMADIIAAVLDTSPGRVMSFGSRARSWMRTALWRSNVEQSQQSEWHFHIDARAEEMERAGLTPGGGIPRRPCRVRQPRSASRRKP